MRVADKMHFEQVKQNVQRNRSKMSDLQTQAATQKRVTKPSDDPVAATRVLSSRVELMGTEQYMKNLNYAKSFIEFSDQTLGELTELLVRAKELTLSQASDAGANDVSRRVTGAEIEQIYNQMVLLSNRKLGDRFIFGGFKTQGAPFSQNGKYQGDDGEMKVHVEKGAFISMNIPGSKVFQGVGLSGDGISHETQLQAKTVEELKAQLAEQERKNQPEQPLQAGQAGGDAPDIDARGPASLRPPTNVGPQKAEDLPAVSRQKGTNIFNSVKKLEVALKTNDKASIQDSIDTIDESISQVILARAQLGSRVSVLNHSMNTLSQAKVDLAGNISGLEDADAFEVISDITKTESALKATMETSGRMLQKSLMDFIR